MTLKEAMTYRGENEETLAKRWIQGRLTCGAGVSPAGF